MKIAISVPDVTYEAASRRAQELGISRSEFFSTAAVRYLAELDAQSLTARMDAAIAQVGEDDEGRAAFTTAALHRLATGDEDW